MLFNKDNNGSAELQAVTGIWSASSSYSVIAPEIDEAMRAVAACVGSAVVAAAEKAYEDGAESPLVSKVQLPVAALAMLRISRLQLVTHDDRGSKVRMDADERIPFEWMVDRDERAQQERYYRAMDALYQHLTETGDKNFLAFRATQGESLVRSIGEFERVYPIDGSYYVYYMLQNLVIEAQPRLQKLVGEARWSSLSDAAEWELAALCRRYLVLSAVVAAIERWSLAVFPLQIARRFAPSYQGNRASTAATETEMDNCIAKLRKHLQSTECEISAVMNDGANPWDGYDPQPKSNQEDKFFSAQ